MRNKYKKREKIKEMNKLSSIFEKNTNFSSAYHLKKTKNPLWVNATMDKPKANINRFNRLYYQKEKEKDNQNQVIKEELTKKNVQINEKDKTSNFYKYNKANGHLSSFISNDKINLNEMNNNLNENIDNDNKIKNHENIKNISYKSNNNNLAKLISYKARLRNKNNRNEINNNLDTKKVDNSKINEGINSPIKDENINISTNKSNNNIENMKNISIKRRHNYSKIIDKIKQNNNLNQIIKKKNNNNINNTEENNNNNNNNNDKKLNYLQKNNNNDKINVVKYGAQKNNKAFPTESPIIHTENNNNVNDVKSNKESISETSSFIGNKLINLTIKPKQSFQFLVHQASKNRELSNSFHKYYESNQLRSRGASRTQSERADCSMNSNTDDQSNDNEKHKFRNLSLLKSYKFNEGDSFSSLNTNINENKYSYFTERKNENDMFNTNNINNIKVLNFSFNKEKSDLNNNENIKSSASVITNNIINNNVYNTTLNFYKISNDCKSKLNQDLKTKPITSKNLLEADAIIYEDEAYINDKNNNNSSQKNVLIKNANNNIQKEYSNYTVKSQSSNNSTYLPLVNLEMVFSLEKKLQLLLDKINKYQICEEECLDYILFFFDNNFYQEETKIFKNKHNKKNFLYNIKIEILCFFLCYDISFSKNFNQAAILLKTIFNIIHSNYLILISFMISLYQFNMNNLDNKNYEIINNLKMITKQELKTNLMKQDMNEYNILQIITNNSKNINNYYKMLIDNLYGQNYIIDDNNIKFPQCLNNSEYILSQNKLHNVISVFFFDAYRLLTNYEFNDLYEFFNIYLNKKQKKDINLSTKKTEKIINDYGIYNNNDIITSTTTTYNKIEKYLLPKMKKYYKYSLVLDLDETLICIKRDSNNNIKLNKNNLIALILRPGLLDFLHRMKQLYELILFSSGTSEYVSPIVKGLEKKEKFFEHILYRQHVTFDDNGNFFKNLNLLNRNVKNIIIVDDNYKNFKYHKLNGICIKPFYGDNHNDKNTLKILGNILYKIRYDADITGDIRISLNKEKNSMIYSQIANNI